MTDRTSGEIILGLLGSTKEEVRALRGGEVELPWGSWCLQDRGILGMSPLLDLWADLRHWRDHVLWLAWGSPWGVGVQPASVTCMVSDSDVCENCQQTGGDPSEKRHYLPAGPPAVCFRDWTTSSGSYLICSTVTCLRPLSEDYQHPDGLDEQLQLG